MDFDTIECDSKLNIQRNNPYALYFWHVTMRSILPLLLKNSLSTELPKTTIQDYRFESKIGLNRGYIPGRACDDSHQRLC